MSLVPAYLQKDKRDKLQHQELQRKGDGCPTCQLGCEICLLIGVSQPFWRVGLSHTSTTMFANNCKTKCFSFFVYVSFQKLKVLCCSSSGCEMLTLEVISQPALMSDTAFHRHLLKIEAATMSSFLSSPLCSSAGCEMLPHSAHITASFDERKGARVNTHKNFVYLSNGMYLII